MKDLLQRKHGPQLAVVAVLVATVFLLRGQGRPWLCECGQLRFWVADVQSSHTSQHLADPYSFTHFQHGLVLFWLVGWAASRWKLSWQQWLAITIEAGWEVLENTRWVIDRYRTTTAALGYTGDTVLNSGGDIFCCWLGLLAARKIGWRNTWLLFLAIEAVMIVAIRDSLLLSVLMLLTPIEAVRAWQLA